MKTVTSACAFVALLLSALPLMAAKKPAPADTEFTVDSVSASGDLCSLSVKDASGAIYSTTGWAIDCANLHANDTVRGHFATQAGYKTFYIDQGYKDNRGREQYSHAFTVSTKTQ